MGEQLGGWMGYFWEGYSHEELVRMVRNDAKGVPVMGEAHMAWPEVADLMSQSQQRIEQLLTDAGASWEGTAGESMASGVSPLAQWAQDAATAAQASDTGTQQVMEAYLYTALAMPEPKPVPSKAAGIPTDFTGILSGQTDQEAAEQQARQEHQRAVELMNSYTSNNESSVSSIGTFQPPQGIAVTPREPSSGPGDTIDSSGFDDGAGPRGGGPGSGPGSGPGTGAPGLPLHGAPQPNPVPVDPGTGSSTGSSSVTPAASTPTPPTSTPAPSGTQPPASHPFAPVAGTLNPTTGAPGTGGRTSGGGPAGRGGAPGSGGGSGGGPGSGRAPGGTPGRGGMVGGGPAASGPAGGPTAGGGSAGARGGAGGLAPMGAGAGAGRRDEDKEHTSPQYLRDYRDEVWDDTPPVAPPVIGDGDD